MSFITTCISGNVVMNDCASSVISFRPTAGAPSLTVNEALGEKNAATLAGSPPHQAAVLRTAKSRNLVGSVGIGAYRIIAALLG
jgi:hypothetical protein